MTDYHQILRKLQGREDVELNLNRMTALAKDAAYRFSLISFAFYDMTFFEGLGHQNGENPYSDLIEELMGLKKDYLQDNEVSFVSLLRLRNENRRRMEALTKEVDLFTLLEYVLNRLEHRFVGEKELPDGYSDLAQTEKILAFLANQKPQESQNMYLYRIAEQLPVRMTKNRFYETVKDRLSIYKSTNLNAFHGILDSLLSVSGSFVYDDASPNDELSSLFFKITDADLSSMKRTDFEAFQDRLLQIGERINSGMDCSQSLQNVLNSFGAVLLSRYEGVSVPAEKEKTDIILNTVFNAFGREEPDLSAAYDACRELEGTLEDAGEHYQQLFSVMDELENRFVFNDSDIKKIGILMSNSSYANLDQNDLLAGIAVDDTVFKTETDALLQAFSLYFSKLPRPFVRASMARVFSILPPHFSDTEGVETYVNEALSGCHDTAEKIGVLELLDGIMRET